MVSVLNPSGPGTLLFLSLVSLIFSSPIVNREMNKLSRPTKVSRFLSLKVSSKLSVMDSIGGNVGFFVFGGFKIFFRAKAV